MASSSSSSSSSFSSSSFDSNVPPFPLHKKRQKQQKRKQNSLSFDEGLDSVVHILRRRRRVVVLAGAGLSVSCGVPDFRSPETGLYATLDAESLGLDRPEDLFDLDVFRENPRPFFAFLRDHRLWANDDDEARRPAPSPGHFFLRELERRGRLLRVYTQNVDGLEREAGVSRERVVHAHGSLASASCARCGARWDDDDSLAALRRQVAAGDVPTCRRATSETTTTTTTTNNNNNNNNQRRNRKVGLRARPHPSRKRRRQEEDNGYDGNISAATTTTTTTTCGGVIKPDITFFGEKLNDVVGRTLKKDVDRVDALLVIGTSLKVAPMSKVLDYLPYDVPRILINRTRIDPPSRRGSAPPDEDSGPRFRDGYAFDACLLGDCDVVVAALVDRLGWRDDGDDGPSSSSTPIDDPRYRTGGDGRTLLFPGAALDENENEEEKKQDKDDENENVATTRDIVHCDGCGGEIPPSRTVMKCAVCFDYDLCPTCYPKESKKHFKGRHAFVQDS